MSERAYSRREFIKRNALTAVTLGAATGVGCERATDVRSRGPAAPAAISTLAGMTLGELRELYRRELFGSFLPNMDAYAVDHEYGGVMCSLDVRTGKLLSTDKSSWDVGRGLWLYSYLYNNLDQKPRYLEIARKSADLLLSLQPAGGDFWPGTFTREGRPISGPGDIYGSLFVAEGLAEYAQASGEKQYRQIAKKIVRDCVERYDRSDYAYRIGHLENPPPIAGPRVLGHWMVLLTFCTEMLKHDPDGELERLARRCVDAILTRHVNREYGLANEILNHDFSLPDEPYAQLSIVGHGLETFAFVLREAERRRDRDLFRAAEAAFKKHVNVAADHVYGGYLAVLLHVEDHRWRLRKYRWCQQEVLNGCLALIEHAGDEWAMQHFARAHAFLFAKYVKPGYKFWVFSGDRKMAQPYLSLMEQYHHSRQLMWGLLSIERMIGRGGRISSLFA
ncbi:MAG: AGE family epimerase/isomerase [Burkholderiales bacterium]